MFALALLAPAAGCHHPDEKRCEKLCWHYNELHFWAQFDKDAADLSPDARAKLKAKRDVEWAAIKARDFNPGLGNCVKDCRSGGSPEAVECGIKAKTTKAADACLK